MHRIVGISSLALMSVGAALALQLPTVDTYTNISSDGINLYAVGIMQAASSNMEFCNAQNCVSPTHTYTQSLTLKSPSGRTNSCSFDYPISASQQFNGSCEGALAFSDEGGTWTVGGNQAAVCSFGGQFYNEPITMNLPLMHIKAYYYYANSSSKNPNGTYSGVYSRCHPIGTTCDVCSIVIGSPPFWQYGLFDGAEIHIAGGAICAMAPVKQAAGCSLPDPVPGTNPGGTAKSRPAAKHDDKGSDEAAVAELDKCACPRPSTSGRH